MEFHQIKDERFRQSIFKLTENWQEYNFSYDLDKINTLLSTAILDYGSSTEENLNCSKKIQFGYDSHKNHRNLILGICENKILTFPFYKFFAILKEGIPKELGENFPELKISNYIKSIHIAHDIIQDLCTGSEFLRSIGFLLNNCSEDYIKSLKGLFVRYQTSGKNRVKKLSYDFESYYDDFEKSVRTGFIFHFRDTPPLLLSDIWREIENLKIPENFVSQKVSLQEWNAMNRFIVLLSLAFEK